MAAYHSPVKLVLLLITWLAYLSEVTVEFLVPYLVPDAVLQSDDNRTNSSDGARIILQPYPLTSLTIWAAINVYQFLWLVYITSTICRRNPRNRQFIYCVEGVIPAPALLFFTAGMVARNMAVIASNRLHHMTSLSASGLTPIFFWASVWYLLRCYKESVLQENRMSADRILILVLLHNGLCSIATWSTLHFNIQTCRALTSLAQLPQSSAGIITLFIVCVEVIAWCILDWTIFRHHLVFVVTPYIVCIVGLAAITDFKPIDLTGSIPSILLGLEIIVTMVRLMRLFWDAGQTGNQQTKNRRTHHAQPEPLPDLIPLSVL
ncbi:uncharacterized protein LOC135498431 [Lineus longissimus]|uniref:uncharacterized protein LOC135498431 n=1 Tax=Lineus longissimus TaxID=88925 RepID=UPI002B4F08B4